MKRMVIFLAIIFTASGISTESEIEVPFPITYPAIPRRAYSFPEYPSHHINFNEIYSNSIAMLVDEPSTLGGPADTYHLPPTQYSEFRLMTTTVRTTTPKPRYPKPSYLQRETTSTEYLPPSTPTTESTTRIPDKIADKGPPVSLTSVSVVPVKNNLRPGVLDIIMPASRVKNFRKVFTSFKRLLSCTF